MRQRHKTAALTFFHMEKQENLSEIIQQAKKGDTNAFGILYEKFFSPVYRYIFVRVRSAPEAEDIAQSVFLKAFQNIRHFEERGISFLAYLFAGARNGIIDRSRKRTAESLENVHIEIEADISIHRAAEARDEFEQVTKILVRLSEDQQVVLTLRFIEGWDVDEVAKHLRKSPEAVRQIQSRGLRKLREEMQRSSFLHFRVSK